MKKIKSFLLVMTVIFGIVSSVGCNNSQKLSKDFDAQTVKDKAEEVINVINSGNYEELVNSYFTTQMKAVLPAEKLVNDIKPVIDELGKFLSFDREAVTGSTDKDTDQEFAVAVIKAKYENRNAQYTISFDKEMRVAGFYIK